MICVPFRVTVGRIVLPLSFFFPLELTALCQRFLRSDLTYIAML